MKGGEARERFGGDARQREGEKKKKEKHDKNGDYGKRDIVVGVYNSSYCRRWIRWMMSRQSLKTRLIFSVSTAHVKCG